MARTAGKTQSSKVSNVTDETVYGEKEDGCLSGNLTMDPELRFTQAGRAVAILNVAVSDRVKDEHGNWKDTDPEFYRVTVWGNQADNCAEYLNRGNRVVAVGYFQDRTFTNTSTGERQTVTEFTAREIGPSVLFNGAKIIKASRSSR